jgi:hypothetical protein
MTLPDRPPAPFPNYAELLRKIAQTHPTRPDVHPSAVNLGSWQPDDGTEFRDFSLTVTNRFVRRAGVRLNREQAVHLITLQWRYRRILAA